MRTIFLCLSVFLLSIGSFAQKLPPDIQTGLNNKYPKRDSITWEKNINVYEITCYNREDVFIAVFTLFGDWRETKTPLKPESLPTEIIEAVEAKHKEVEFYDIFKVETSDGRDLYELKTDTEIAGYLIRAYEDGRIHVSKKIYVFED